MDKKSMLADLRLGAGLTKRAEELNEMAEANKQDDNVGMPEIYSAEMQCFKFESVIRPSDNALVIHLKHLPPALRNGKFFDFATEFIRDRIGKFEALDASFIGELDQVNKLNSLDLIFTKYYPAIIGDMEYIKSHTARIGSELDNLLVREIGNLQQGKR